MTIDIALLFVSLLLPHNKYMRIVKYFFKKKYKQYAHIFVILSREEFSKYKKRVVFQKLYYINIIF